MDEMVAFSSKRLSEQEEDAAGRGANIGRGSRELGSPLTVGGADVECGRVCEDMCERACMCVKACVYVCVSFFF